MKITFLNKNRGVERYITSDLLNVGLPFVKVLRPTLFPIFGVIRYFKYDTC